MKDAERIVASAVRFAWPAAFVVVAGMTFAHLREGRKPASSEVRIDHPTPTVLKDLRELSRLESLSLHVEKVVEVNDHQARVYGLIDAKDSLLYVATGEVILGIDLAGLRDQDVSFDPVTRTAHVLLPSPEVLVSRFDEPGSFVHARSTDVLAKRNEALETIARRDAVAAFEAAGRDPKNIARAKEQAERQIRALGKAWGAADVVVTFRPAGARAETARANDPVTETRDH